VHLAAIGHAVVGDGHLRGSRDSIRAAVPARGKRGLSTIRHASECASSNCLPPELTEVLPPPRSRSVIWVSFFVFLFRPCPHTRETERPQAAGTIHLNATVIMRRACRTGMNCRIDTGHRGVRDRSTSAVFTFLFVRGHRRERRRSRASSRLRDASGLRRGMTDVRALDELESGDAGEAARTRLVVDTTHSIQMPWPFAVWGCSAR